MSTPNFTSALERAKAIAAKLVTQQQGTGANGPASSVGIDSHGTSGGYRKRDRDTAFVDDPSSTRKSFQMEVPSHMVPLIIGRGGETLKGIESSCNASINLSERNYEEPSKPRIATIIGEEESIQAAKKRIDEIVHGSGALNVLIGNGGQQRPFNPQQQHQQQFHQQQQAYNANNGGSQQQYQQRPPDYQTIQLQVPATRVGLVIGRGGETIKDLQQKTGARINVVKEDDHGPTRTIIVGGNPQQLSAAQREIEDIVNGVGYVRPDYSAGGITETVRVPKDKIGLVIGRGGDTIKQIQHEARCKLNIEQHTEADGDRIVTVTGTAEAIALARELINEKVGVKKPVPESQFGTQFDPDHAKNDAAYAAAYGSGPLSAALRQKQQQLSNQQSKSPSAPTPGSASSETPDQDLAVYIDYYKKYYESMGYVFPPDFDFQGYLAGVLKASTSG